MFFVSGITGQVGGAATRQLLEEGYTVRTLARDEGMRETNAVKVDVCSTPTRSGRHFQSAVLTGHRHGRGVRRESTGRGVVDLGAAIRARAVTGLPAPAESPLP